MIRIKKQRNLGMLMKLIGLDDADNFACKEKILDSTWLARI